ncbi:unnamed protein product [Closterium sp. NIES-54]
MHRLGSILRTVRSVRPITAGHGALSLRDVPVFGPNTSRLPVSFLGREISSVVPVADAFAVSNAVGGSNGTYLSSRRVAVPTSLRSLSGLIPSPPATGYALRAGRGELVRAFASKSDAATGERDNDGKGEVSSGRGSSGGGGEAAGKELRGEGSDGGSGGAGGASDVDFMAAVIIDEGLAAEVAAREQTDKWKDLLAVPHVGKSRFVNPFPFLPLLPAVASSTPSPHPALFPLTHHSFPSPSTPSPHPALLPLTHHSFPSPTTPSPHPPLPFPHPSLRSSPHPRPSPPLSLPTPPPLPPPPPGLGGGAAPGCGVRAGAGHGGVRGGAEWYRGGGSGDVRAAVHGRLYQGAQ